jgi:hypothetical protein
MHSSVPLGFVVMHTPEHNPPRSSQKAKLCSGTPFGVPRSEYPIKENWMGPMTRVFLRSCIQKRLSCLPCIVHSLWCPFYSLHPLPGLLSCIGLHQGCLRKSRQSGHRRYRLQDQRVSGVRRGLVSPYFFCPLRSFHPSAWTSLRARQTSPCLLKCR